MWDVIESIRSWHIFLVAASIASVVSLLAILNTRRQERRMHEDRKVREDARRQLELEEALRESDALAKAIETEEELTWVNEVLTRPLRQPEPIMGYRSERVWQGGAYGYQQVWLGGGYGRYETKYVPFIVGIPDPVEDPAGDRRHTEFRTRSYRNMVFSVGGYHDFLETVGQQIVLKVLTDEGTATRAWIRNVDGRFSEIGVRQSPVDDDIVRGLDEFYGKAEETPGTTKLEATKNENPVEGD